MPPNHENQDIEYRINELRHRLREAYNHDDNLALTRIMTELDQLIAGHLRLQLDLIDC